MAPSREMAWDCACGSGQATEGLVEFFDNIIATDASAAQLTHAPAYPRVVWQVARAEESGLPDQSVDVVLIAQALHWFDVERFWAEVRRVVRPGGVVAALSYAYLHTGDRSLDALLRDFMAGPLGEFWPPERRHVDAGYGTLPFPFERLEPPAAAMTAVWDAGRVLGYMRSWSATRRAREVLGSDPVTAIEPELRERWGTGEREVQWPLSILAGVV
ncbi:MAG TPA: class I SAM-dependent methyltransferase [Gemmatimonadales bacterium]|nr:class I SAM-dependent methyltransferase [Gemmatimonadales bacterium]